MHVIILQPGLSGRSSFIDELTASLQLAGAEVTVMHPAILNASAPLPSADVVVLKDKTPAGLFWGRRFHLNGVPTISPYPVTELCRNKLATNRRLTAAGLPVPACYEVREPDSLAPLLAQGPLIIKPVRGSQGRGITIVYDENDLPVHLGGEEVFAQRYLRPDGLDHKIYRIGKEVFCVDRVWPPVSLADKHGRLIELDHATRTLAIECGEALGCEVYGVDIIEHGGQPWIVDVSSLPGFKGVPDAGARLAAVVLRAGTGDALTTAGG